MKTPQQVNLGFSHDLSSIFWVGPNLRHRWDGMNFQLLWLILSCEGWNFELGSVAESKDCVFKNFAREKPGKEQAESKLSKLMSINFAGKKTG